jgi:O-methyltransferase / aklanonic acid methyltransferase
MNDNETPKERIADLYDRVAPTYGQIGPNYFAYAGQHLVEHLAMPKDAQVLDVAAGRGANLFSAVEAVGSHGRVIGIDLAPGMIQATTAEIQRRNLSHVSLLQMDAEHLTFPNASFDYVLCGFAIFLFPHLEQALSEFFRVLRPAGKLGLTVAQDIDALSRWYSQHVTVYHERYQIPWRAGGGKGGNYSELPRYLSDAGFSDV